MIEINWKLVISVLFILLFFISGCSESNDSESETIENKENSDEQIPIQLSTITDDNYKLMSSDIGDYIGSEVNISGEIFSVYDYEEIIIFIMYPEGILDSGKSIVVDYNYTSFEVEEEDCVRVNGILDSSVQFEDYLGRRIKSPAVSANEIKEINCKEVHHPSIKTININKSESIKDVVITLEKVEFSEEHTRAYLKIENNANNLVSFNDFESVAFQGEKRFDDTYSFDFKFTNIESEIYPNTEEEGVVLLEPLDYSKSGAKFQFLVRSETYSEKSIFTFEVDF